MAGLLLVLLSQFFLKNWMQSLHICRTELLSTQRKAGAKLQELMGLNSTAERLRVELAEAQERRREAMASRNPILAAKAQADIVRIKGEQAALDREQKALIANADQEMSSGVNRVVVKIRRQSQELQSKLPDLFAFQIRNIQGSPQTLAVHPDRPETAPVYELKNSFKEAQALHVSWNSEFKTKSPEKYRWIQNRHKKQDGCDASLEKDSDRYREILIEGKSSLRL